MQCACVCIYTYEFMHVRVMGVHLYTWPFPLRSPGSQNQVPSWKLHKVYLHFRTQNVASDALSHHRVWRGAENEGSVMGKKHRGNEKERGREREGGEEPRQKLETDRRGESRRRETQAGPRRTGSVGGGEGRKTSRETEKGKEEGKICTENGRREKEGLKGREI